MSAVRERGHDPFVYLGFEVAPDGTIAGHYGLGQRTFTERWSIGHGTDLSHPATMAAISWLYLFAGVSYYKALAPSVVDTGMIALTEAERSFLRTYYLEGLGEFAHRNGLDLSDLEVRGPLLEHRQPVHPPAALFGPLIPFGGGIDSIVTVEQVRAAQVAGRLFVASPPGQLFEAIEAPAMVTGFDLIRATRELDPAIRRSAAEGYFNGHVPVTAVISALAVVAAVALGHEAVLMSNEHSASDPNLIEDGRAINHQWSKSLAFEEGFAQILDETFDGRLDYCSVLRARTELWVAERFARYDRYHHVFRSCNKAFTQDPATRAATWCGRCDKCCFIDLILAPFVDRATLVAIFSGTEPLEQPDLRSVFEDLVGIGTTKPFECVGDVGECRAALALAAARPDRASNATLAQLANAAPFNGDPLALLEPQGIDHVDPRFVHGG